MNDIVDLNIVEKYTNAYPSEEKRIAVLIEANDLNTLNIPTLNYILNDETEEPLIDILESYLNDLEKSNDLIDLN